VVETTEVTEFDALFRAVHPRLVRALTVAAGPEAAADAVQDAFVQAHAHWARVGTLENPAGWIWRAAVNRLANHHRGLRRRDAAVARLAPPPSAELDPSLDLDVDLARAVAALPDRQRLAICLHYLADLSVIDVAAAMGLAEGTVKSHLHDARKALQQTLGAPHDG
jgi:RNA polymerase sigma-70 factor (ECF subfamily)